VLDFSSALYLGLRHPSRSLRPWPALTTGKPAALASPSDAAGVAGELAALQGCERATLLPSTLHLFWDLFGLLARERVRIYMEAGTYAVARWGVERAAAQGAIVRRFPHRDASAARALIERDKRSGGRPIVVADGFCPICGTATPLAQFLQCVECSHGQLVLDDTQALGVLGAKPDADAPFGRGGGGSLRWHGLRSPAVIVGSSLAKGFGVPMAVLCGSEHVIDCFEAGSETRVHSSPPSLASLHAAEHALAQNRMLGDRRRLYLWRLVERFRAGLRQVGLAAGGAVFPVQMIDPVDGVQPRTLHQRLLCQGIRTVLVRCCRGAGTRLGFVITVLHRPVDIDRAVEALARATIFDRVVKLSARAS